MNKLLMSVLAILLSVVSIPGVLAQQRAHQIVYCRFESPVALRKWLDDCQTKIRKMQDEAQSDSLQNVRLSCQFSLDKIGNPTNLSIVKTSGSKEIDDFAISILKKAAPYKTCPSKSLSQREILVQFNPGQQATINLYPRDK